VGSAIRLTVSTSPNAPWAGSPGWELLVRRDFFVSVDNRFNPEIWIGLRVNPLDLLGDFENSTGLAL
jgi:hypothetical protein